MRKFKLDLSTGKAVGISSGAETSFTIASYDSARGVVLSKSSIDLLIAQIIKAGIGVLIVDPLAELHNVPENDNGAMRTVIATFRDIAQRANCAILIAAHTRKQPGMAPDGSAGNQDALRGAGSQTGVARIVFTLVGMSAKEGKRLMVPESERSKYQRLDIAKGNITPNARGTRPEWLKWESVALGNGDSVGVLMEDDLVKFKSRVTAEPDSGVAEASQKAVAIADVLEDREIRNAVLFSDVRDEAASKLGVKPGQGGVMGKFAKEAGTNAPIPAGKGRTLVFTKAKFDTAPYKVMLLSNNKSEAQEISGVNENAIDFAIRTEEKPTLSNLSN